MACLSVAAGGVGSARFGRGEPAPREAERESGRPRSPAPPLSDEDLHPQVFPLDFALADSDLSTLETSPTDSFIPPSPLATHSSGLARSLSSYGSLPNLRLSRSRPASPPDHLHSARQPSPERQTFDPSVLLAAISPKRLNRSHARHLSLQLPLASSACTESAFPCVRLPASASRVHLEPARSQDKLGSSSTSPGSTPASGYSDCDQLSSSYERLSPPYNPSPAPTRTRQLRSQLQRQRQPSHRRDETDDDYDSFDPLAPLGYTLNGKVRRPKGQPARMFKCNGFGDCKMVFTRSEHLARHVRKHTGERPFRCHCGRTFSRLDNVRQHAATVHSDQPELNHDTLSGLVQLHNELSSTTVAKQAAAGMVIHDPAETAAAKAAKKRRTTGNLRSRAEADAEEAARMVGRGKFAVEGVGKAPRARTQSAPVRVNPGQLAVPESPRYSPYSPSYVNYQDQAGHYGSPLHQHAQITGSTHYQPSPVSGSIGSHSSPYGPGPSSVASPRRPTPLSAQHSAGSSSYYGARLTYGGQVSPGTVAREAHYAAQQQQQQQQQHQIQHHYSHPNLHSHHSEMDDGSSDAGISSGGRVTLPSISRLLPSHSDPRLTESYYAGQDPASSAQSGYGGEMQHQQHLAMQHYQHQSPYGGPAEGYARPPEASGSPGPSNGSSFEEGETVPHSSWAGAGPVGGYGQIPTPVSGVSSAQLGYTHAPQADIKPFTLPSYPPTSQAHHDSYSNQFNQLPGGYAQTTTPHGSPARGYANAGGQRESSERSSIPVGAGPGAGGWAAANAPGGGLMEMVVGGGPSGSGEGAMWAGSGSGGSARYQLPPQAVGTA